MSSSPEAPHSQTTTEAPRESASSKSINQAAVNGHGQDQLAPPEQPLIDLSDHEAQVTSKESPARAEANSKDGGVEPSRLTKENEVRENGKSNGTGSAKPSEPKAHLNGSSEKQGADTGSPPEPHPSDELASTTPADLEKSPPPPPLPPKGDKFLPNTQTAEAMAPLSSDPEKEALRNEDMEEPAEREEQADDMPEDSRSEIQSIMTQFQEGEGAPGETEIMSPRLEIAQPMFTLAQHPPRKSSLEPIKPGVLQPPSEDAVSVNTTVLQSPPPRTSSLASIPSAASLRRQSIHQEPESPLTPQMTKHLPPPPQPEPELPFDFHRFLEQLRHRSADPVARFLRSFLLEFGKRQWMVHEQVKIISDFLEFISKKMAQCEVWQTVSDAEFDNSREGMEKLVMNRLYNQTFSPAIPPPQPVPGSKGKRRGPVSPTRPGRRGQHQEDVERDQVLAQKVRIYGWVTEEHLDIRPIGDKGKKFMTLAQQGDDPSSTSPQAPDSLKLQIETPTSHYLHKAFVELLKINSYRAPRDKVICILNCCKVIFGFLRNTQHDQSADSFIPLLIYVVLHANPEHLVSNVQYILRFRNQDKLGGEAGYYISSLMGAIQFIENLDRTSLTISDEEFEKHVERAVSAIAEKHSAEEETAPPPLPSRHGSQVSASHLPISEKSSISRPEVTPRNSLDAERALATPRRDRLQRNGRSTTDTDESDEMAAVTGLLKTIQRPLSTIGRIFSDDGGAAQQPSEKQSGLQPPLTPQPARRQSPSGLASSSDGQRGSAETARQQSAQVVQKMSAQDAAARQASAEAEEARKLRVREESNVVETLCGMFPGLDRDVIVDVVRANEGRYVSHPYGGEEYEQQRKANFWARVGSAVDACLALSQ